MVVLYFGLEGGFSQGYHSHTFLRFCRCFKVSSGKLLRSFPHDVHVNYASMRAWDWWEKLSSTFFVRLPFETKISWQNSLVGKKWNIFKTTMLPSQHITTDVLYFCSRNRYVTCGIDAPEMVVDFFQRSRWSPLQLRWWWEVALFWSWCGTATGADDCDGWDDFRHR